IDSKKACKLLKLSRLLPEISGRADQFGEVRFRNTFDGRRRQQTLAAQVNNGPLDVRPACILREDGSDDHLKAGAPGPPFLRTMGLEQCRKIVSKCRKGTRLYLGRT